jgi:hypothetical protein
MGWTQGLNDTHNVLFVIAHDRTPDIERSDSKMDISWISGVPG